ncbi:MAG: hypothetical protein EOM20_02145 [Spartobacteria bacterium]|nr:hypothetical protein [Spartobacteria bacterium]
MRRLFGSGYNQKNHRAPSAWRHFAEVVRTDNFPTHFGVLSYEMYKENGVVCVDFRGRCHPAERL